MVGTLPLCPAYGREHDSGTTSRSRGGFSPELCVIHAHLQCRGRRECRVHAAPAVSCAVALKKSAHEHKGEAEAVRHPLRNGFTAYAVLSPATNSSCHRRPQDLTADRSGRTDFASEGLGASNGRQDHTVLPYAAPFRKSSSTDKVPARRSFGEGGSTSVVLRAVESLTRFNPPCDHSRARRCRVHRIPALRFVTTRNVPHGGPERENPTPESGF